MFDKKKTNLRSMALVGVFNIGAAAAAAFNTLSKTKAVHRMIEIYSFLLWKKLLLQVLKYLS